jgi:hypothetical protein
MTRSHDIGPGAMDRRMNDEPRRVRGPTAVPTHRTPGLVDEHHVAGAHQPEVPPQRVRPERLRVLRVAHRNVARHAFREAFAREHPERERHVFQHPFPVRCE